MWIDPLSDVTKCISCNRRTVLRLITKYENKYQHPSNQWWKLVETNEHMSSAENFHLTLIVEEFGEHVMWIDPLSDVTKCISCNRRTVLSSQKSFMFNRIGYEIITKCSYMWKIFKSISDFQRRCSNEARGACDVDRPSLRCIINNCYSASTTIDCDYEQTLIHKIHQLQQNNWIMHMCHVMILLNELNVLKEMIEVRAGEKICNCMAMGDVLYIISDILGHWRPIPNYSKCLSLWNTNFLINAKVEHHKTTAILLITKYDNENKYYTEIESSLSRRKFSALLMCSFVSTSFHH
ncbi:hypothetical protein GQR58_030136 [Nymphon striatum]|nr:hypothetical protein GQR58_030136 [Nymphon striatum]